MKGESVTSGSKTRQKKKNALLREFLNLESVLLSVSYGILLKTCIACWAGNGWFLFQVIMRAVWMLTSA